MKRTIVILLLTVLFSFVSYSQNIDSIPELEGDALDNYGKISFLDETARIDSLLVSVFNSPSYKALIVLHFDKKVAPEKNLSRLRKIFKYVKRRNFDKSRIIFAVIKDGINEQTWLWTVPPEAKLPISENQNAVLIRGEDFQKTIKTIFSNK